MTQHMIYAFNSSAEPQNTMRALTFTANITPNLKSTSLTPGTLNSILDK